MAQSAVGGTFSVEMFPGILPYGELLVIDKIDVPYSCTATLQLQAVVAVERLEFGILT
jgi:hypothetical protein